MRHHTTTHAWLALALVGCATQFVDPELSDAAGERLELADRELEVLFAPDDDPIALEVEQIRQVTEEFVADGGAYADGANPFRIRYAVYNLRNEAVVDALADARDAGVEVQVLVEADQLDASRDWNWADEALAERGWAVAPDHRLLSAEDRVHTPLIGIDGSGLMHLKTRLFETPTHRVLVTGSMNPGDNAMLNDESWHLVRDERLIDRYSKAYDAVLYDEPIVNEWVDGEPLQVLFSPAEGPSAGARIMEWLAEEDEQILLMVYSVRDLTTPERAGSLVSLLGERVAAGVPVVLITDRKQSDAWGDATEDRLREVGVVVYEATNDATEFTAMHHKSAILGRTHVRVITDAANWSASGLGSARAVASNVESSLFIEPELDGGHTGRRYLAQFMRTLERYADQASGDGEPSYEDLSAVLMGHVDWPEQAVHFAVDEAYTDWGEGVFVVGDQEALGWWGQAGVGAPLGTDGEHYPAWATSEPVWLPVGGSVQFKFVARQGDQVRWERSENRAAFVQPEAFGADEQWLSGTWR